MELKSNSFEYKFHLFFIQKITKKIILNVLKSAKILGGKTYEETGKWTRISIGTLEQMQNIYQDNFWIN